MLLPDVVHETLFHECLPYIYSHLIRFSKLKIKIHPKTNFLIYLRAQRAGTTKTKMLQMVFWSVGLGMKFFLKFLRC
jgi:hypothetical protein